MQTGSCAPEHACHVVQHRVRLRLVLKELDIGVEEVTLGDVDLLGTQLVDEAEDARGDGSLSASLRAGKGALGGGVLEDYAIQFRDVHLHEGG